MYRTVYTAAAERSTDFDDASVSITVDPSSNLSFPFSCNSNSASKTLHAYDEAHDHGSHGSCEKWDLKFVRTRSFFPW